MIEEEAAEEMIMIEKTEMVVIVEDQADQDHHQEANTDLLEEVTETIETRIEIAEAEDMLQDLSQLIQDHKEEDQAAEAMIEEETDREMIVALQKMIKTLVQRDHSLEIR